MTSPLPPLLTAASITRLNPNLLNLALTHASRNRDHNNERLEFLGDRVLSLALARALYDRYPNENEGDMALRHARLARADQLVQIARAYHIQEDLTRAGVPESAARQDNVLADTVEALIGAVYLDHGYDTAAQLVQFLWAEPLATSAPPPRDPKTILQEWAQGRGLPLPDYTLIERTGPDHAPSFVIEVQVKGLDPVRGTGATRRLAEKAAATAMTESIPL